MFGGLTHRPATQLAELLVKAAPEGLTKVPRETEDHPTKRLGG